MSDNNMERVFVILFLAFVTSNPTFAQKKIPSNSQTPNKSGKGIVEFPQTTVNFGNINIEGGRVSYDFVFKNVGTAAVQLTSVIAGCGCTTTSWTKEEVKPGEQGYVRAVFDPKGRQGPIDKIVTVQTNGEPAILNLRLEGNVVPTRSYFDDIYKYRYGNLAVSTNSLDLKKIYNTGSDSARIYIYNLANKNIKITKIEAPRTLYITKYYDEMVPNGEMVLNIKYKAVEPIEFGPSKHEIKLYTTDDSLPVKSIFVYVDVVEDFSYLKGKAAKKAPKAEFDKTEHDFGNIRLVDEASTIFTLTNKGKNDLIIRKIIRSCNCISIEPSVTVIKKGKSAAIKVSYKSVNTAGQDQRTVKLILNDPQKTEVTLTINAYITH